MFTLLSPELEDYALRHTRAEPRELAELEARTYASMQDPQMLTGRVEGRFLKLLALLVRPKLVVEVGTFTGYSALSMAEALDDDARVITCDVDPDAAEVARAAFARSPHGKKIELRLGPALETLRGIAGPVDLSFIDADKTAYPEYYEALLARTRRGGVLVLDNMLQSGRVLAPKDDAARAIHGLNERIARDERVENVLLAIRDGVQVVVKR